MIQYIDVLKVLLDKDPGHNKDILRTVEALYFLYVRHPLRRIASSEEARIANDIVNIETLLVAGANLSKLKVRSKRFRETKFLTDLRAKPKIDGTDIAQLEREHLDPCRFYITAVFIANLVKLEHNKDRLRWALTIIFSAIASLAALIKVLGDLHATS